MIKSDLNLKEVNGVSQKEVLETLEEAYTVSNELRDKLSKIRIHIYKSKNPEIIEAITHIFGNSYISRTGDSTITYDMYCSVINLIRTLGKSKSEEIV